MGAVLSPSNADIDMVKLAREIAMDIQPLEAILKQYGVTGENWGWLQRNHRFQQLLSSESEAWNTALNTHERVKIKAACMMEEWLPELNGRLHDPTEPLPAKIEGAKMLSKIAAMGLPGEVGVGMGERFVVTINLGPSVAPLEFTKDVTKTIDHSDVISTVKQHEGH